MQLMVFDPSNVQRVWKRATGAPRCALLAGVVSLLAGCLYLGGINHGPQIEVSLDESASDLRLDGTVVLRAEGLDEDGDELKLSWSISGTDLQGEPFGIGRDGQLLASAAPIVADATMTFTIQRRGSYDVAVEAQDPQGATRSATLQFEVPNQSPTFALALRPLDPSLQGLPAHARYVVSVVDQQDDGDLDCQSGAKVSWELLSPDEGDLQLWRVVSCEGEQVLDKLELRGRLTDSPLSLKVRATVDDGDGASGQAEGSWTLEPNRPPCILRTDPDFNEASKVFVLFDADPEPGDVGRIFDATHVDDDVPEHRFVWSTSTEIGGPYVPLAGQPGRTYGMAPDFARQTEPFYLRLVVQDSAGDWPGCEPSELLCADDPRLPQGCYRWVTWKVEFL